jgi:hypothetical protein
MSPKNTPAKYVFTLVKLASTQIIVHHALQLHSGRLPFLWTAVVQLELGTSTVHKPVSPVHMNAIPV